ncbi:hypothetical protein A3B21_01225 [Candidatus Uhrbacteria bacterium RIFCSPLOWO2_01_FULL_47_24]|uniref:Nucleotidyl transferase AbiEii/AbiGii toxin family protein n=1 Tax=Candidatus Uhrbacteria bacterium RIFCSPLOWO2_01_FULL_47_24 TaxID=1802401 RepID=A0A1F7URZ3_9BACT|nr:MAG: hypothetical protein A2753_03505 [Candidatus Uhrbacteria bacterium RIFCSPHIGHO2_01_FULL_47_11]OGL67725.1 MAG: hypothetical protein A3D58_00985 [Candidatus Uhrbacteria bacterium RIFCSPHIGHO2_02_FULL_46_47]OGL75667.1 MAG: hypothetical protein A3F52_04680 [Candidatus Uhrbacteria bacterium RIFCSPHIGHO2_12_FULL_47_11]OGL81016.1 MAG: hypothetical protein A3B21_01225 [Candidatus Uhrbacteria bacterium RIFCSPLOWO2_01_FULL_47_24]OGL84317.1 MAG: hypothetical protein A3J03_00285 [Candidatus Uhrbact
MFLPKQSDAIHKAWLYRLLSAIYNSPELATVLYFKGGTCAAMLGWLDRFSIDLDFDYAGGKNEIVKVRSMLEQIFADLNLEIKDSSRKTLQYFLRYPVAQKDMRNTIKIDTTFPLLKSNQYAPQQLADIDRTIICQTKETMFANKLVALIERYELREAIASRDLYDVHHFFMQGFRYHAPVIYERRKTKNLAAFFKMLIQFVDKHITQRIIDQDLNVLLSPDHFRRARRHLKRETLMFLRDELQRIEGKNK